MQVSSAFVNPLLSWRMMCVYLSVLRDWGTTSKLWVPFCTIKSLANPHPHAWSESGGRFLIVSVLAWNPKECLGRTKQISMVNVLAWKPNAQDLKWVSLSSSVIWNSEPTTLANTSFLPHFLILLTCQAPTVIDYQCLDAPILSPIPWCQLVFTRSTGSCMHIYQMVENSGPIQNTSMYLASWMPVSKALQIPGPQPALGSQGCLERCLSWILCHYPMCLSSWYMKLSNFFFTVQRQPPILAFIFWIIVPHSFCSFQECLCLHPVCLSSFCHERSLSPTFHWPLACTLFFSFIPLQVTINISTTNSPSFCPITLSFCIYSISFAHQWLIVHFSHKKDHDYCQHSDSKQWMWFT